MMRAGHYGAAMLAVLPVLLALGSVRRTLVVVVAGALVGARLPDIDQRVPFVPHRGPTHTIRFAVLGGLLAGGTIHAMFPGSSIRMVLVVGSGPTLGVLSHLLADAITPAGVRPLWPLYSRLVSLDIVRAENPLANRGLFLVGLLSLALIFTRETPGVIVGG